MGFTRNNLSLPCIEINLDSLPRELPYLYRLWPGSGKYPLLPRRKPGISFSMNKKTRIHRSTTLPFVEVKTGAGLTYPVRRHSHNTLSFGFVEKGSSKIICRPLEFNMSGDQVIMIPPDTIHLCQPEEPAKFTFRILYLDPEWIKATFGIETHAVSPATATLSGEDKRQKKLFFDAFETLRDRPGDRMRAETKTIFFLEHLLFRTFRLDTLGDTSPPDKRGMEKVKNFLDREFTRDIQLDDLETLTGMSRFSILRQFKKHWQLPPHAYVINKRILLAKQMLRKGSRVADTAVACGFFDQSHFVKTFKNFVGVNPVDYK